LTKRSLGSSSLAFDNNNDAALSTEFFNASEVWDLTNVSSNWAMKDTKFSQIQGYYMDTVYIHLILTREPMNFLINSIFPCLVLNVLTLLMFGLPQASQMNISMTVFLTFAVYSTRIVSEIPAQGDYLPRISLYFLFSLLFAAVTFGWFALDNVIRNEEYLPGWLEQALMQVRQFIKSSSQIFDKKNTNRPYPNKVQVLILFIDY
jgi:hypothetical protein